MLLKNTNDQYGLIAILLHWIMAILLIGMIILGLYMTSLPTGLQKLKLYGWHKEYGLLVLWLVMLRLGWRVGNPVPALSIPHWERVAARAVHWAFYIFMFALPLTGWVITSAAGLAPSFFGLFVLPQIAPTDEHTRILFEEIHEWLAYGLIGLITLHVCAALKHHFIDRDDILRRML